MSKDDPRVTDELAMYARDVAELRTDLDAAIEALTEVERLSAPFERARTTPLGRICAAARATLQRIKGEG